MTRYIDADALLKELRKSCEYHAENSREFSLLQRDINIVREQPTIDAIPVSYIRETINENEELYETAIKKCAFGVANACNNRANELEILLIDWSEQNEKTD